MSRPLIVAIDASLGALGPSTCAVGSPLSLSSPPSPYSLPSAPPGKATSVSTLEQRHEASATVRLRAIVRAVRTSLVARVCGMGAGNIQSTDAYDNIESNQDLSEYSSATSSSNSHRGTAASASMKTEQGGTAGTTAINGTLFDSTVTSSPELRRPVAVVLYAGSRVRTVCPLLSDAAIAGRLLSSAASSEVLSADRLGGGSIHNGLRAASQMLSEHQAADVVVIGLFRDDNSAWAGESTEEELPKGVRLHVVCLPPSDHAHRYSTSGGSGDVSLARKRAEASGGTFRIVHGPAATADAFVDALLSSLDMLLEAAFSPWRGYIEFGEFSAHVSLDPPPGTQAVDSPTCVCGSGDSLPSRMSVLGTLHQRDAGLSPCCRRFSVFPASLVVGRQMSLDETHRNSRALNFVRILAEALLERRTVAVVEISGEPGAVGVPKRLGLLFAIKLALPSESAYGGPDHATALALDVLHMDDSIGSALNTPHDALISPWLGPRDRLIPSSGKTVPLPYWDCPAPSYASASAILANPLAWSEGSEMFTARLAEYGVLEAMPDVSDELLGVRSAEVLSFARSLPDSHAARNLWSACERWRRTAAVYQAPQLLDGLVALLQVERDSCYSKLTSILADDRHTFIARASLLQELMHDIHDSCITRSELSYVEVSVPS